MRSMCDTRETWEGRAPSSLWTMGSEGVWLGYSAIWSSWSITGGMWKRRHNGRKRDNWETF